ncbi:hypothetical protein [Natrinema soli]|uniref:Uncharacterized protein n=1 Tax=Natrinema soli TaxID=1930624 RepID=A0ABD5SR25_9EURY|nr:hypothetical protein [Natrinema soli]
MKYLYDALNFSIGVSLMAVTSFAALQTTLQRQSPNTIVVDGSGTGGSLLTMALFALGCFFVAHSLFSALDKAGWTSDSPASE